MLLGPGGIHATLRTLPSSRPRSLRPAITLWSPCRVGLDHVGPGARRPWSQVVLEPGAMMQAQPLPTTNDVAAYAAASGRL